MQSSPYSLLSGTVARVERQRNPGAALPDGQSSPGFRLRSIRATASHRRYSHQGWTQISQQLIGRPIEKLRSVMMLAADCACNRVFDVRIVLMKYTLSRSICAPSMVRRFARGEASYYVGGSQNR